MAIIKDLIKRNLNVFCQKNWLNTINKELELSNKYETRASHYKNKAFHHREVSKRLMDEYLKLYPQKKEQAGAEDGNTEKNH